MSDIDIIETGDREALDTGQTPEKSLRETSKPKGEKKMSDEKNKLKSFFNLMKKGLGVVAGFGVNRAGGEAIGKIPMVPQNEFVKSSAATASLYGVKKVGNINNKYYDYVTVGSIARNGLVGVIELLKVALKKDQPLPEFVTKLFPL